ncbi:MAG: hypothetical protein EZS28_037562, partial [Streblomastix strix]
MGSNNGGGLGGGLDAMGGGECLVQDNESGKFEQAGINGGIEGDGKVLSDANRQEDVVDLDRQCGGGVSHQKMASEKIDARNREKNQSVVGELWNRALDEAYYK